MFQVETYLLFLPFEFKIIRYTWSDLIRYHLPFFSLLSWVMTCKIFIYFFSLKCGLCGFKNKSDLINFVPRPGLPRKTLASLIREEAFLEWIPCEILYRPSEHWTIPFSFKNRSPQTEHALWLLFQVHWGMISVYTLQIRWTETPRYPQSLGMKHHMQHVCVCTEYICTQHIMCHDRRN